MLKSFNQQLEEAKSFVELLKKENLEIKAEILSIRTRLNSLLEEWELLESIAEEKGGSDFMQNGVLLTNEEVLALISLCHPDKHNNRPAASNLTQKFLQIKKERGL